MPRGRGALALLLAVSTLLAGPALAQADLAAPAPSELERRLTESSRLVRAIRVEGAKSLPASAVAEAVKPFEHRALGAGEVRELQARLNRLYADNGFITSGVVAGPDALAGDVLTLTAVEGTVTQVRFVRPPKHARAQYLTRLLVPDDAAPVHLGELQERLAWLRDSGVVDRINAEVVPLAILGESELVIDVEEPRPWFARLDYDNRHSPTVGARRATLVASHRNLTGWGDALDLRYGDTEGLNDWLVSYSFPVPKTRLRFGARRDRSDSLAIGPEPFRVLDIKALSTSTAYEVSYALVNRSSMDLSVYATREERRSDTTLLGIPFSFVPGIEDGRSRVDVDRVGLNFSSRGADRVIFARAQASRGRANVAGDPSIEGIPARNFTSYFVQAQIARRLPWNLQGAVRFESQYSPDTLMPLERYALGGSSTVRGYRENLLLRERVVLGSIEIQRPLTRTDGEWRLSAALFADGAWSRNTVDRGDAAPRRIASAGVGVLASGPWGLSGRIYVARPSVRWLTPRDDLQDRGVHFALSWEFTRLLP